MPSPTPQVSSFASVSNINVVLGVFNLIPIPPLDGSRFLAWILPQDLAYHIDRLEPYGMIIIFVLMYLGILNAAFDLLANPVYMHILYLAGIWTGGG